MKTIPRVTMLVTIALAIIQNQTEAQVINWKNISTQRHHLLHVSVGAEYGVVGGLGYHHLIPVRKFPLWIGGEFSIPAGNEWADDFKARLGAQTRIAEFNRFQFTVRVQGILRRYHNQSVSLFNFGSDFAGTLGYYRKHWFLGAEAGFDKAIVTHFKHSEWFKQNIYSTVADGWYEPATGGNFYYGLQGGYSLKKIDVTLKAGRILGHDFRSQPILPFYGQLGVNLHLGQE